MMRKLPISLYLGHASYVCSTVFTNNCSENDFVSDPRQLVSKQCRNDVNVLFSQVYKLRKTVLGLVRVRPDLEPHNWLSFHFY